MKTAKLCAAFELDKRGKPVTERHEGEAHFHIVLYIEDVPKDIYAVTYMLHETFLERVRESRDAKSKFAEQIVAYGDFAVQAKLRGRDKSFTVSNLLSRALRDQYGRSTDPLIREAIEVIKSAE